MMGYWRSSFVAPASQRERLAPMSLTSGES